MFHDGRNKSIGGDKPSGHFITTTGEGLRVEGETRQCAHCQFTWQYQPGSGRRFGLCLSCNGLLCGNPGCAVDQQNKMEHIRRFHPELADLRCIRHTDWVALLAEEQLAIPGARLVNDTAIVIPGAMGDNLISTPLGIVVAKP